MRRANRKLRRYTSSRLPSVAEYIDGLEAISQRISEVQRRLLVAQYHAPFRTVTAPQLATLANVRGGYPAVNAQYGRFGHIFCDEIGFKPVGHSWWSVWSAGYSTPEGFAWELLPQVAEALESLGWVTPSEIQIPQEVPSTDQLIEGAIRQITVNAYERNQEARRRCIEHYGASCTVCEIDLGLVYGPIAQGFIHVHHLKPLSEIGTEYEINPVADLRPMCPNCHSIIHLGGKSRSIEEIRELMEKADVKRDS